MLRNFPLKVISISALAITLLVGGIVLYESRRVLPAGTTLGSQSLAGLNRAQASDIIAQQLQVFEKKKITVLGREEKSITYSPSDLGMSYDPHQTTTKIFDRSNWMVRAMAGITGSEESDEECQPMVHINEPLMRERLVAFLETFEFPAQDARFIWQERNWEMDPDGIGYQLAAEEIDRMVHELVEGISSDEDMVLVAAYDELQPSRTAADISETLNHVSALIAVPTEWQYGYDVITIDLADAPGWFQFDDSYQHVSLNQDFAKAQVKQLAYEYDRDPGQVVVTDTQELVSEYDQSTITKAVYEGSFRKGRTSNQEQWLTDLETMVQDLSAERKKELAHEIQEPTVTSLVPGLEFPQILSTGVSSYRYGNHPNRVKNIKLSLGSLDGVIVQPGEEVSFNRLTGWITPRKGYTKTKIISAGRVEEGVGGGVCQSSTTAYRAVLNAGFPVTERRNHTLDVSYYHAYGYGLDATVYTDSRSDMKFVNDFPGPMLIHTYTIDDRYEAFVEFYGTTDGRSVELTNQYTGDYLYKQWEWKIVWPDREEIRYVKSRYQLPKEDEEEEANPLEA